MTKEELFNVLEPLTVQFKEGERTVPYDALALICRRWLDTSGLDINEAFDAWNNVMAELVIKHNLGKQPKKWSNEVATSADDHDEEEDDHE